MGPGEVAWVQLLAFSAGGQHYVLDVMRVRELVRAMPLLPLPGVPPWVLGQMVLRGEVMPVLSLALCAAGPWGPNDAAPAAAAQTTVATGGQAPGQSPAGADGAAAQTHVWAPQILVLDASGHRFGLLVDRVREVLRLPPEALLPDRAPQGLRSPLCFGLCEIRGQPHVLLDVRPLVAHAAH